MEYRIGVRRAGSAPPGECPLRSPMPPVSRSSAAPTESLSGSVKSVVFHNEETGWFVATVAVDGGAPGGGATGGILPQIARKGKGIAPRRRKPPPDQRRTWLSMRRVRPT